VEQLDEQGLFWIPEDPDLKLAGRLQFDPLVGIELSAVAEHSSSFNRLLNEQERPRIVGAVGSKAVTLIDCLPPTYRYNSAGLVYYHYSPGRMLIGHDFGNDPLEFAAASVRLSNMAEWVDRTGIELDFHGTQSGDGPRYRVDFTPLESEEAPFTSGFTSGRLSLRFGWAQDGDGASEVRIRQWPVLRIDYDERRSLDDIMVDIGHLQDMLTLCVDQECCVDLVALHRPDLEDHALSGRPLGPKAIELRYQPVSYVKPAERRNRHRHQMLLTYDSVGGITALARWLDVSARLEPALGSLMTMRQGRPLYAENRFLNVSFAAEAYHRSSNGGLHMPMEEFDALYKAIEAAVPVEHRGWLSEKLTHANQPTLGKRLKALAGWSKPATRTLIADKHDWAYVVAQVRNELTHLDADRTQFNGGDLYWLAESVFAVVRICLLLDCGLNPNTVESLSETESMTWARRKIEAATNRARTTLRSRNP
jgi:hypothetical protein